MLQAAAASPAKMTIKDLRSLLVTLGATPPAGLRKFELMMMLEGVQRGRELPASVHATSASMYDRLIPKRADASLGWRDHLDRYGWAVVADIGCAHERYADALYAWLEGCSPVAPADVAATDRAAKARGELAQAYPRASAPAFRRDDPSTWLAKNMPQNLHGIFKHYLAHADWQWELRELCYPIFAELYGYRELLCSFDGGCFLKPLRAGAGTDDARAEAEGDAVEGGRAPAVTGYKQWLHLDQDRLSELSDSHDPRVLSCAQGLVALTDSGPEDGGLVLVERSHEAFAGYLTRHPADGYGWFRVDISDPELAALPIVKVCASAGSLVLWDSRVVHANCPPSASRGPRMCVYVSMQPRAHANAKELAKRVRLFEAGRQTGHWTAGHLLKATSRHPMTRGGPIVMPERPFCVPTLSAFAKKLVGYQA
jgi:hypothetical protein